MDTTQEKPKMTAGSLKELLDKLAWQRDAEALYEAFTEALESIGDRAIKSEVCMNTVRYMATQNATSRVTAGGGDEELANIFEEECKRFSDDLLEMPGQFRVWLKKHADRTSAPRATAGKRAAIVDILVGLGDAGLACDCERCVAFRTAVGESVSETPTEVPPPPDPIN